MSGLNRVDLIGRLGRDPEVRRTGAGDPVVSFSVATSETWRDKATGERKERTEWHNVVIFNEGIGKIAEQYLKKGSQCFVSGQLQTREYTDRDGGTRRTTEVVLQRFRGDLTLLGEGGGGKRPPPADDPDGYGRTAPRQGSAGTTAPTGRMADVIDDDIPF